MNLFDDVHVYTTRKIYDDLPVDTKPKAMYTFYNNSNEPAQHWASSLTRSPACEKRQAAQYHQNQHEL